MRGGDALLLLGVAFHALYVLSIFDIYFKSPVVSRVESLQYTASTSSSSSAANSLLLTPPAKRVVVFVADGCRADKFFETNASNSDSDSQSSTHARVTFLRRMAETRGSYGVSHTRVPTESRPGHVALFAGMYEDVSAVTKGWQDNPVDFDSVFNQSHAAWLFGSPDIVPMFTRTVPHATAVHYSHADEDFATDASALDVWVYEQVTALFTHATHNETLATTLRAPQLVVFCHFLGIDSNGHAHRPSSKDYVDNIALVDELVAKIHALVEAFYGHDGRTAYVFSADHGMSNKGAHGDGDPANTRTPLVVWGAGVHGPEVAPETSQSSGGFYMDLPTQSSADVRAQLAAQASQETVAAQDWGRLVQLTRKDVMQADVAPLVSALLGLPYPRNSVGVLPFAFLAPGRYRAGAVLSNARQLYEHARRKEQEKEARTLLFFRPFRAFRDRVPAVATALDALWDAHEYDAVERASQELVAICLETLTYFQRYDWVFLFTVIVLGYVGWMVVLAVAFVHPTWFHVRLLVQADDAVLGFLLAAAGAFLLLESSPVTYFLYVACPIVFWNFVWRHRQLLWQSAASTSRQETATGGTSSHWRRGLEAAFVLLCLELVVLGFAWRFLFGIIFTLLGLWPLVDNPLATRSSSRSLLGCATARDDWTLVAWTVSCYFISVFPYLSTEYGEHTVVVFTGGSFLMVLTIIAYLSLTSGTPSASTAVTASGSSRRAYVAAHAVVGVSIFAMQGTTWFLTNKQKPPVVLTLANWTLSIAPIAVLLLRLAARSRTTRSDSKRRGDTDHQQLETRRTDADRKLRALALRMLEIVYAFSPSYILLSISYEVYFFAALCCVLASWIALEARVSALSALSASSSPSSTRWHEVRRAFFFLLLIKIAFFGTGNVASMSSFELSSTYRFVTVFSPFLMGALLVVKLLIPFLVVACAFHVVLEVSHPSGDADSAIPIRRHPPSRYFLLVVGMSDVLALHFLFLVKNEGSWKEIGNSISMFGIANALIVFVPLLFMLANLFVRDLLAPPTQNDDDSTRRKTQ